MEHNEDQRILYNYLHHLALGNNGNATYRPHFYAVEPAALPIYQTSQNELRTPAYKQVLLVLKLLTDRIEGPC